MMIIRFHCFSRLLKSLLPSNDNHVRWHAETNHGHLPLVEDFNVFRPRLLKSLLPSRDMQVRWHTKTNYGLLHLCYLEIIKSDGTRRQIMVIHTLFAIQRQESLMACGDKLWSSALLCYLETIKSDDMWRQIMVIHTPLLSRDNQV